MGGGGGGERPHSCPKDSDICLSAAAVYACIGLGVIFLILHLLCLMTMMCIHTIVWPLPVVDWVIAEVLCVKQGGYGGRARYILKDALKYIPLYGWHLGDVSS